MRRCTWDEAPLSAPSAALACAGWLAAGSLVVPGNLTRLLLPLLRRLGGEALLGRRVGVHREVLVVGAERRRARTPACAHLFPAVGFLLCLPRLSLPPPHVASTCTGV